MFKFGSSFLGYVDAYTDATSVVIAHSCDDPLAQTLSVIMAVTFVLGVVVAQWGVVAYLAIQDPSQACFMKVLHMDALASCVSLPKDQEKTWHRLHMARTLAEDVPQALLQTVYTVKVKQNYFVMLSVCVGLASSAKAMYDAFHRALLAAGAYAAFR